MYLSNMHPLESEIETTNIFRLNANLVHPDLFIYLFIYLFL